MRRNHFLSDYINSLNCEVTLWGYTGKLLPHTPRSVHCILSMSHSFCHHLLWFQKLFSAKIELLFSFMLNLLFLWSLNIFPSVTAHTKTHTIVITGMICFISGNFPVICIHVLFHVQPVANHVQWGHHRPLNHVNAIQWLQY